MFSSVLSIDTYGVAVALAALGAVLFGLAAVRQHGAVQDTMTTTGARGLRHTLMSLWRLVRQPTWLIGTVQAIVAGGLHILALALAPITVVQPIGVLAVPVTVLSTARRAKRRPSRWQVIGSVFSVAGVVGLTLVLLMEVANAFVLPPWWSLALTVLVTSGAGTAAIALGRSWRPLARCVTLASAAAALFGLNSILIRTIGHIVTSGAMQADRVVLVTAIAGILVALPVGLWAMQTAYVSGSPQVVICCLTLLDPLSAVAGGSLLLHDGSVMHFVTILTGAGCAVLAVVGVVFLAVDYPARAIEPESAQSAESAERGMTPDPVTVRPSAAS